MHNLNLAFEVAEKHLDIPKMLDAEGGCSLFRIVSTKKYQKQFFYKFLLYFMMKLNSLITAYSYIAIYMYVYPSLE